MGIVDHVDPDGLLEYSVVFNDRSLNSMSKAFQQIMRDISASLRQAYHAEAAILVPGGGTFGMEAIARQFAVGQKCLIIRNGWFSFRWTEIWKRASWPVPQKYCVPAVSAIPTEAISQPRLPLLPSNR